MKSVIKVLAAVAVISTPLFAEPTLEDQKHESSLMMDGMKSLNSSVPASWVSKEQTEAAVAESAAILKETKTETAPAVAREKVALTVSKNSIAAKVPEVAAEKKTGSRLGNALRVRWETLKSLVTMPVSMAQCCYELAAMNGKPSAASLAVMYTLIYPVMTVVAMAEQVVGLVIGKNFFE